MHAVPDIPNTRLGHSRTPPSPRQRPIQRLTTRRVRRRVYSSGASMVPCRALVSACVSMTRAPTYAPDGVGCPLRDSTSHVATFHQSSIVGRVACHTHRLGVHEGTRRGSECRTGSGAPSSSSRSPSATLESCTFVQNVSPHMRT